MRQPGIEPGPLAWKASILTTGLLALKEQLVNSLGDKESGQLEPV